MLEKTVEAYLVERVRALGGTAYKFTSPARASVPDRIVILPPGRAYFVEVKRPGGKLTRGQEREHEHLRRLGADVRVLDSIGAINAFLNEVQAVAADGALANDVVAREQVEAWARQAGIHQFTEQGLERLGDFAILARAAVSPTTAESDSIEARIAALMQRNPADELGPTDEPESQYRFGYNTAIEDALIVLESGGEPATADERAAPIVAADGAPTFEQWFSSLSPQRRALIGSVWDARMGFEAARAAVSPATAEPRECCNADCGWKGDVAETMTMKHGFPAALCPRCHEVTECGEKPATADERAPRDDGFFAGVCVALQVLTTHGQGVIWKDIVKACGVDDLLQYAANVEPEEWELAGFKHFARSELGRRKPAARKVSRASRAATPASPDWKHIANEWADVATNGIQAVKNVRDGVDTADEAIARLKADIERCRALATPDAAPAEAREPFCLRGAST